MTSFNKWPIGRKLRFMNYVLLVNMLLCGGVGYWISQKLGSYLNEAINVEVPAVRNFGLMDMVHDGTMGLGYRAIYVSTANDVEAKASVKEDLEDYTKSMNEYVHNLEVLALNPESRSAIDAAKPNVTTYMTKARELINLALAGKKSEAEAKIPEFQIAFKSLEDSLGKAGDLVDSGAEHLEKAAHKFKSFADFLGFAILIQGLIVGLTLPWFIFRSLLSTMDTTIDHLTSEATQVRSSAGDIRVSSENLSSATTEQASALQETASSIEEMNAMIKKSSENANKSQDVSKQSHSAAEKGKEAVVHMMQAIDEINASNDTIMKQTEDSNRKISDIVKVIQEIGNKTKVINDIVFQTKLLSFNASVEAARAGEHGKGFAVVAEEVGNLATMSGNAAKEISEMLDGSIKQVESIIGETKRSIERLIAEGKAKVQAGTEVAKQCSSILDEVVNNVTHVDSMIQEIASASREQAQGVGEITRAMNQLDNVTHQNSSTSTQVASSSEQLARQSETLMDVVNSLKSFVYGSDHMHQQSPTPRTEKRDYSTPVAQRLTEMAQSPAPAGNPVELKMSPVTQPTKPVPGVSFSNATSKMKMAVGGGAMDHIPSEDDSRFKDM